MTSSLGSGFSGAEVFQISTSHAHSIYRTNHIEVERVNAELADELFEKSRELA